jgi:hypothetical protein
MGGFGVSQLYQKTNIEKINDKFLNKPFDANEISDFLESLGYVNIETGISNFDQRRFKFWQVKSPRTLIVYLDKNNNIKRFSLHMTHIENPPKENYALGIGCLVIVAGIVLFALFGFISIIFDGSDSEYEEYNPYTEDFDGDGLHGDKDDHEILHNLPTMPTSPMGGE